MKKVYYILAVLLLSACGGSSNNTTTNTVNTEDIITTEGFAFKTSWPMEVDFTIPVASGSRFLSLCTTFTDLGSGNYDVDYDSCLIRALINNGVYNSYSDGERRSDNISCSSMGVLRVCNPHLSCF